MLVLYGVLFIVLENRNQYTEFPIQRTAQITYQKMCIRDRPSACPILMCFWGLSHIICGRMRKTIERETGRTVCPYSPVMSLSLIHIWISAVYNNLAVLNIKHIFCNFLFRV